MDSGWHCWTVVGYDRNCPCAISASYIRNDLAGSRRLGISILVSSTTSVHNRGQRSLSKRASADNQFVGPYSAASLDDLCVVLLVLGV